MAAPWDHQNGQGGFNPPPPFQNRPNFSLTQNMTQEWMGQSTRPYTPLRSGLPRQNQGLSHAPPQQPPPQAQNFLRASAPRANLRHPSQAHPVLPPVSQYPRQQENVAMNNEALGYQFNNSSPRFLPPRQQFKPEQRFDIGQAFSENINRYPSHSLHLSHSNQQDHQQAEYKVADFKVEPGSFDRRPDTLATACLQGDLIEDFDRQSAEVWIKNWERQRKKTDMQETSKQTITISEAQEKTRQMIVLLARLQFNKQQLESMKNEDKTIWEQKLREVVKIKSEFEVLHRMLTSEETIKELGKKIRQRQSKRRRLKRLKQERFAREQEEAARREEKHREIDRLMEQVKQKHEQQKQEEAMKKEGDQILAEVKKKMSESTKSIQLLESLQKLRKLRTDRLERQGVLGRIEGFGVAAKHKQEFEETVTGMTALLHKQLTTYKAEEEALKVILETEHEETREKEREKLVQRQEERRQQELRKEEQRLFGCQKEARPGDPLYPFAEYYKAAETSLEALISIRHDWDMHLVLPETPGASQIPDHWVYPSEPSSGTWRSALGEKT